MLLCLEGLLNVTLFSLLSLFVCLLVCCSFSGKCKGRGVYLFLFFACFGGFFLFPKLGYYLFFYFDSVPICVHFCVT